MLGGVAPVLWLAQKASETLAGKEAAGAVFREIAETVLEGAEPLEHNRYKVELTKTLVRRALEQTLGR